MSFQVIKQRTIWWPTFTGWAVIVTILTGLGLTWCWRAESFFSLTERQPADILVVEGWTNADALAEVKNEFVRGGYRFVVATGGMTSERWSGQRWSLAEESARVLLQSGLPKEQVILAKPADVERHRTFASAVAVWRTLRERGIQPKSINVFSLGVHGRRSRLVYAKVEGSTVPVGVISWSPGDQRAASWWNSSSRTLELLKETVGYPYELLLNSGRWSNDPDGKNAVADGAH